MTFRILSLLSALAVTAVMVSAPSRAHDRNLAATLAVEGRIAPIQNAIRSHRVTCEQIVRAYQNRIQAFDSQLGINAVSQPNLSAARQARRLDAAPGRIKQLPLFCVTVLVKDNIDTKGIATTAGSVALADNFPRQDATIVRKLKAAGAIVLAKTNMAEWAFSPRDSASSSFGTTANAYDRRRTPAGSSGGTASGIAASFALTGIGSDTGNSIRGPSSFATLVGMRPTLGLVSRQGIVPLQADRDTAGPITRTVEDNARMLSVMAGYDPQDPITAETQGRARIDYTRYLRTDGLMGARIGVVRALAPPAHTDPAVLAAFNQAIEDMKAAGAVIVDPIEIPHLEAHLHDGYYCQRFAFDVNSYLRKGKSPSKVKDVADVFKAGTYAPGSRHDFQRFLKDSETEPGKACPYYLAHPGRAAFLHDVEAAMDGQHLDALVYPTWRFPPPLLENATKDYRGDNSQLLAPPTGMPALTVPDGFTDGLPAGIQFLGRRYQEGRLYALAYSYEQKTHWRHPPPDVPALGGDAGR